MNIREEINRFAECDAVIISHHARVRMFERNISTDDLQSIIRRGEIIESYPDDPCPAVLMLGFIREDAYHLVLGICEDHLRVITTYNPDEGSWIDARTRRRGLIPEKCTFCKGTLHEGKTEFIARVADEIIVIRDVPACICDRCGEAYYTLEISKKIDLVMKDVHNGRLCCRPLAAGEVELTG